jgi:hypothetical protein
MEVGRPADDRGGGSGSVKREGLPVFLFLCLKSNDGWRMA